MRVGSRSGWCPGSARIAGGCAARRRRTTHTSAFGVSARARRTNSTARGSCARSWLCRAVAQFGGGAMVAHASRRRVVEGKHSICDARRDSPLLTHALRGAAASLAARNSFARRRSPLATRHLPLAARNSSARRRSPLASHHSPLALVSSPSSFRASDRKERSAIAHF